MAETSVGPGPTGHIDDFDLGVDLSGENANVDDFDFDLVDDQNDQLVQQSKSPFEDTVGGLTEPLDEALAGEDGLDVGAADGADEPVLGGAEFDIDEIDYNLGGDTPAVYGLGDNEQHSLEQKQEMTLEVLDEGGQEDALGATDAPNDDPDEITYEEQLESVDSPTNGSGYTGAEQKESEAEDESRAQHRSAHEEEEMAEDVADYEMDATGTPQDEHSSHDNDSEADESARKQSTGAQPYMSLGLDKAGFSYETDQDSTSGKVPDVTVVYANTEYPLFGNPETDDPDHYFFEDLDILRYPLSRFLQSIRGVITEWIGDDEEVRVLVHGLNLEFGETTTDALLEQVTFYQLLSLHSTLCRNDESDGSTGLRCTVRTMSHCALRIKKLVECASQGRGYGWLETEDGVNQSSGEGTEAEAISQNASQHGETEDDDDADDSSEDHTSSNEHEHSGLNIDTNPDGDDDDNGSDQYGNDDPTPAEALSQADAEEIITNLSPALSAQANPAFVSVGEDEQLGEAEGIMDEITGLDNMLPPVQNEDGGAGVAQEQDLNDPAYSYLELDTAEVSVTLNDDEAAQQPVDDEDYLDLGGGEQEAEVQADQGQPNFEDDVHNAAEAATSATATLDGDEIDYEDHTVAATTVVDAALDTLASNTMEPLQHQQTEADEIDWDDGEKLASVDNGAQSPQSITGKRAREVDETEGLAEEHDVKRHRA